MVSVNTVSRHDPSDACELYHCYWHGVDEPWEGALICGECFHVYRSNRELVRLYRVRFWRNTRGTGLSLRHRVVRMITVRASSISFCQYCIHDF